MERRELFGIFQSNGRTNSFTQLSMVSAFLLYNSEFLIFPFLLFIRPDSRQKLLITQLQTNFVLMYNFVTYQWLHVKRVFLSEGLESRKADKVQRERV